MNEELELEPNVLVEARQQIGLLRERLEKTGTAAEQLSQARDAVAEGAAKLVDLTTQMQQLCNKFDAVATSLGEVRATEIRQDLAQLRAEHEKGRKELESVGLNLTKLVGTSTASQAKSIEAGLQKLKEALSGKIGGVYAGLLVVAVLQIATLVITSR